MQHLNTSKHLNNNDSLFLFNSTRTVHLVYLYYSVYVYCFTVLLCNLAQEFPSGLIKFYLI